MYLSTFKDEAIVDPINLVIKSLFILVFITHKTDTDARINTHPNRELLKSFKNNAYINGYTYMSLVNPSGFTLVSKFLPKPLNRRPIEEDFLFVETESLYDYLQTVDSISATIALN